MNAKTQTLQFQHPRNPKRQKLKLYPNLSLELNPETPSPTTLQILTRLSLIPPEQVGVGLGLRVAVHPHEAAP